MKQATTLALLFLSAPFASGAAEVPDPFEAPAQALYSPPAPAESSPAQTTKDNGLRAALQSAYATHPNLKAARAAQAALAEEISFAATGYQPDVRANIEAGRERNKINAARTQSNTPVTKSIIATQPLFRGGRTVADVDSATKRVEAGEARLKGVEQAVLLAAVSAYTEVVEAQSMHTLNQSNVQLLTRQLGVTRARFDAGELTRTDVAQAEARLKQAEAELRQAEAALSNAAAGFERVVGYAPENLLPPAELPKLPESIDEAKALAKTLHPEVLAALSTEEEAGFTERSAYGALLPEVSLRGSLSRGNESFQGNDINNDTITLNVSIPLYQSGSEYARIRQAAAQKKEAQFKALDVKLSAVEAAAKTYEDFQASLAVIASTKAAIAASEVARDGVKQESEYGVRTVLDLLDAEQELFREKVNLVRAERNNTLQAYRVLAAIGKLTASNLNLGIDPESTSETSPSVMDLF